jgi:nucleoside-diphosphate-sugar epimerase
MGTNVEPEHAERRPGDVRHSHAAIDRAREVLGYKPLVDFETGLRRTVEFFAAEE